MERLSKSVAILIMGPMRAGKTTAAGYFREKYGIPRHSCADKLKELQIAVTGNYEKDREWLQQNGEGHRKVFGEDFWANQLTSTLFDQNITSFAVDDIRYPNEFERLMSYSMSCCDLVIPIFVKVSLENMIARGGETSLMNHESEEFARRLQNNIKTDQECEYVTVQGNNVLVIDGNLPVQEYFWSLHSNVFLPVKNKLQIVDIYEVEGD